MAGNFHTRKANEENYIILSGEGKFQINDEVFNVAEGQLEGLEQP